MEKVTIGFTGSLTARQGGLGVSSNIFLKRILISYAAFLKPKQIFIEDICMSFCVILKFFNVSRTSISLTKMVKYALARVFL